MPPPPNRRSAQKERTRARILAAARARFLAGDYETATIREVAAAAGVAVGSVHAHFHDKRALLRACLLDDLAGALRQVWEVLDEDAALPDQLVGCARELFTSYARHPALSRVMVAHTLFSGAHDEPDPLFLPFLERVAGLYARAAERGEIELRDGDALLSAQTFFALYLSTLIGGLGGAFGNARSARARAEQWAAQLAPLVQIHVRGLAPGNKRRTRRG